MSQPSANSPSSAKACHAHISVGRPGIPDDDDDASVMLPLLSPSSKPSHTPPSSSLPCTTPSRTSAGRGYLFVILASLFFACDSNVERFVQVTGLLSSVSLIYLEGVIVTLLSLVYLTLFAGLRRTVRRLSSTDAKNLLIQGGVGASALVCLTVAFKHIPSGVALSIFYTNPIVAILVARVVLRERVTRAAVVAVMLAVVGALLVTHNPASVDGTEGGGGEQRDIKYGLMLAFCGALFGAFIPLRTRILMMEYKAKNNNEELPFMLPCLSVGLIGTCLGLVLGGYVSAHAVVEDRVRNVVWKCMPGVLVFAAQAMVGMGFQLCDAGTGAIMLTMELPMAYGIQTMVLGEQSSMGCTAGAVLLLMSAVTVAVSKVVKT